MASFPEPNAGSLLDPKLIRSGHNVPSSEFDEKLLATGGMNSIETFFGLIETTADALRIVELCRVGKLGRVSRRLHEKERQLIRSGSVFVFDELESGIKRWTDGRVWSPSRILGNFLIYRELERKSTTSIPQDQNTDQDVQELIAQLESDPHRLAQLDDSELAGILPWLSDPVLKEESEDEQLEVLKSKKLLNNHKGRYVFKPEGLIKKTISIRIDGHPHHLICYYNKRDFCQGHLGQSSFNVDLMRELRRVKIPPDLLAQQSFRKPTGLTVESAEVVNGGGGVTGKFHQTETLALKKPTMINKRRNSFPCAMPQKQIRSSMPQPTSFPQFVPIAPAIESSFADMFPSNNPPTSSNGSLQSHNSFDLFPEFSRSTEARDDTEFILGLSSSDPIYIEQQADDEGPNLYSLSAYDQGCWQNWLDQPIEQPQPSVPSNGRKSPFEEHDPMFTVVRPPSTLFEEI